ncbi:hypothetical protein SmJEL517_g01165 [Synchytrium microbalum]|uniref:Protein kinase domain-containing protein n=1 Tax=Synchytrium microbalum TaxID=1806994 RepID=A0A507CB90_9FUNG|nr:uncharacterized protein SmJEL517_g01165 [Synchytrium microbalum]TPX36731.1 hypothetical protein SmJEL517_g01165 [Synchytrium microbalum]
MALPSSLPRVFGRKRPPEGHQISTDVPTNRAHPASGVHTTTAQLSLKGFWRGQKPKQHPNIQPSPPAATTTTTLSPVSTAPAVKEKSLKDYTIIGLLGEGGQGRVLLAENIATGQKVALKQIMKEFNGAKPLTGSLKHELKVLKMARGCPFLISASACFQDKNYIYVEMEYVEGVGLGKLIDKKPLNTQPFEHGDIKADNIMITRNGQVKVLDYGLSRLNMTDIAVCEPSQAGTLFYMSPEMLGNESYGRYVDFWALGVLLYEMANNQVPFLGYDEAGLLKDIQTYPLNRIPNLECNGSTVFRAFTLSLVIRNKKHRLGMDGVGEVMKHEYFVGMNLEDFGSLRVPPPLISQMKKRPAKRMPLLDCIPPWKRVPKLFQDLMFDTDPAVSTMDTVCVRAVEHVGDSLGRRMEKGGLRPSGINTAVADAPTVAVAKSDKRYGKPVSELPTTKPKSSTTTTAALGTVKTNKVTSVFKIKGFLARRAVEKVKKPSVTSGTTSHHIICSPRASPEIGALHPVVFETTVAESPAIVKPVHSSEARNSSRNEAAVSAVSIDRQGPETIVPGPADYSSQVSAALPQAVKATPAVAITDNKRTGRKLGALRPVGTSPTVVESPAAVATEEGPNNSWNVLDTIPSVLSYRNHAASTVVMSEKSEDVAQSERATTSVDKESPESSIMAVAYTAESEVADVGPPIVSSVDRDETPISKTHDNQDSATISTVLDRDTNLANPAPLHPNSNEYNTFCIVIGLMSFASLITSIVATIGM